jgi:hypothetical protein
MRNRSSAEDGGYYTQDEINVIQGLTGSASSVSKRIKIGLGTAVLINAILSGREFGQTVEGTSYSEIMLGYCETLIGFDRTTPVTPKRWADGKCAR